MSHERIEVNRMTFEEFKEFCLNKVVEAHHVGSVTGWKERIVYQEYDEGKPEGNYIYHYATIIFPEDIASEYHLTRHHFQYSEAFNYKYTNVNYSTHRLYIEEISAIVEFDRKYQKHKSIRTASLS